MIYPCKVTSKNGSPSNCHCVGCTYQVEKGTTSMAFLKAEPPHGSVTPNHRKIKLVDLELSSECSDGVLPLRSVVTTRQRRKASLSSTLSSRSHSRPIPISLEEQIHRTREMQDIAEAESFYDSATWRMYRRIMKYRQNHPLPDSYFSNNDEASKQADNNSSNFHAISVGANAKSFPSRKDGLICEDESKIPLQNKDVDDEDDEHCMMFELDLS